MEFELFMGCLGNGITLCNKAVMEHGDYKIIGHISKGGNLKLYVNEDYIPNNDMQTIKRVCEREKAKFQEDFLKLPPRSQFSTMDRECWGKNEFTEIIKKCGIFNDGKVNEEIIKYYFSVA